jgi:phosphatidate phosphatase APP1
MVKATLLHNARTRIPFPGVAAFYAALQQGSTGTGFNPIFYVSSSPWNLYDVLEQFLALQKIPMGPTLLRDWGMSLDRIPFGHAEHKLSSIRGILATYPDMRFILMGDSGQQDPEIYREVIREYPGRILCAYIRDVTVGKPRAAVLASIVREIESAGAMMVVAPDTITAARHAAGAKWIRAESLPDIAEEATSLARLD